MASLKIKVLKFWPKLAEIRHAEELSLCRPVDVDHLKFNYGEYRRQEEKRARGRRITLASANAASNGGGGLGSMADVNRPDTNTFVSTLGRKTSTMSWTGTAGSSNGASPSRFRSLGRNGGATSCSVLLESTPTNSAGRRHNKSDISAPINVISLNVN